MQSSISKTHPRAVRQAPPHLGEQPLAQWTSQEMAQKSMAVHWVGGDRASWSKSGKIVSLLLFQARENKLDSTVGASLA